MSSTRSRSSKSSKSSRRTNQRPTTLLNLPREILEIIAKKLKSEGAGPASGTLTSNVHNFYRPDPQYIVVGEGNYPVKIKLDKTAWTTNGTNTTQHTRKAFANAIKQRQKSLLGKGNFQTQTEILKSVYGDPNSAANRGNFAWEWYLENDLNQLYPRLRPRTGGRFDPKKKNLPIGSHGTRTRYFRTVPIGTRERGTRNDLYRSSKQLGFLRNNKTRS